MMDRLTMYPIAFVTTVQPWLAAWVLSISFFLTIGVVALLSRGRRRRQVIWMLALGYAATVVLVGLGTWLLLDIQMVSVEVLSVEPRSIP